MSHAAVFLCLIPRSLGVEGICLPIPTPVMNGSIHHGGCFSFRPAAAVPMPAPSSATGRGCCLARAWPSWAAGRRRDASGISRISPAAVRSPRRPWQASVRCTRSRRRPDRCASSNAMAIGKRLPCGGHHEPAGDRQDPMVWIRSAGSARLWRDGPRPWIGISIACCRWPERHRIRKLRSSDAYAIRVTIARLVRS